jgi:propionyl-CoA carboxylase alpha chain
VLVVLDTMKMEHRVRARYAGAVAELGVLAGQAVEMGTVRAVVDAPTDAAEGQPA